jgi:hypothetical protein
VSTPEQTPNPTIQVGALNGANTWDLVRIDPGGGGSVEGRLVSITHVFKEAVRLTIRIDENNLEIPLVVHPDLEIEIVRPWRTPK